MRHLFQRCPGHLAPLRHALRATGYHINSIPSAQIPLTSTISRLQGSIKTQITSGLIRSARLSRLMLVTPHVAHAPTGGRALLSQLNLKCLKAILADRLVVHALRPGAEFWMALARRMPCGATSTASRPRWKQQSSRGFVINAISRIFLDGSNLGRLARAIKRTTPSVEVLTFFHNVEARFFFGALKQYRSAHALGVLAANYVSERMAVRYSDRLITLSKRDSAGIADLYGRAATDVLPMAIEDKLRIEADAPQSPLKEPYALFVGGAFYANQSGIRWFVENVVPEVSIKTCIVGKGLEVSAR